MLTLPLPQSIWYKIKGAVAHHGPENEASWGYEYGVLLTVAEARIALAALQPPGMDGK